MYDMHMSTSGCVVCFTYRAPSVAVHVKLSVTLPCGSPVQVCFAGLLPGRSLPVRV